MCKEQRRACRASALLLQVDALESLCRAIFAEVLELRAERDRALAARTLLGHLRNVLGYLLSFYCLFR